MPYRISLPHSLSSPSSTRKRNFLFVGLFCTAVSLCQTASGFVTPPTVAAAAATTTTTAVTATISFSTMQYHHRTSAATSLQAHKNNKASTASTSSTTTATTTSSSHNKFLHQQHYQQQQQQHQRLTHEEQTHLLQLVVEARRIRRLESELAMASKQIPLRSALCQKAEYATINEMEDALDQGARARETLVTRNMGLVHYCLQDIWKEQRRNGNSNTSNSSSISNVISKEDLVQEGAIGLARAVDRWNPDIGGKFSTYAVYWVRAMMLRYLAERKDVIRVPEHVSTAVRKVTAAAQRLGLLDSLFWDEDSSLLSLSSSSSSSSTWKAAQAAKVLAEEAGLTDKQVSEAIKIKQRRQMGVMSFESWMQQGKDLDSDTASFVGAPPQEGPSSLEREDLTKTLSRFLRPREMEALSWRYGLIREDDAAAPSVTSSSSSSSKRPRNYVAEAEEHLFGNRSNGMRNKAPEMPVRGKWGEAMSFTEVGKRMHVSAEYGRRLCHTALTKLRQAAEEGALEPMFLY